MNLTTKAKRAEMSMSHNDRKLRFPRLLEHALMVSEMSAYKPVRSLSNDICIHFPFNRLLGDSHRLSGYLGFAALGVRTRVFAVCFFIVVVANAETGVLTNDPVTFFKQAIGSPPDVETYVIGQRTSESKDIQYFRGARSETNYFLCMISDSNAPINSQQRGIIFGRAGASMYEITQNAISYAIGTNALTSIVNTFFNLTCQFLDMGASEIEPKSVKWSGNEFAATTKAGLIRYGTLEIADNLPSQLELSAAKGSPPYKVIEYAYPQPPMLFAGFPSKMIISTRTNTTDPLRQTVELTFQSVQLAKQRLFTNFFGDAQFADLGISYTNIDSNSVLYTQSKKLGKMIVFRDSPSQPLGFSNPRSRVVIYWLAFATVAPIVVLILWWIQTNKQKAKEKNL